MEKYDGPNSKILFRQQNERTGIAGIFAASLELIKEGVISVSQKNF